MNLKTFGLVVFTYLSFISTLVSAQDDDICLEEILELNRLVDRRCNADALYSINRLFKKAANGEISLDVLRSTIENACQNINNTLECLKDMTPVIPECHSNPLTQFYRNDQLLLVLKHRYLCEHNPPRYLDFLKYDGISCYANDANDRCMSQKTSLQLADTLLDDNICNHLGIIGQCINTYENCTNKYVDNYLVVLNELAVDAFNCPKHY